VGAVLGAAQADSHAAIAAQTMDLVWRIAVPP
jgi:hypothetical protein